MARLIVNFVTRVSRNTLALHVAIASLGGRRNVQGIRGKVV